MSTMNTKQCIGSFSRLVLFLFLIFNPLYGSSQTPELDSLKKSPTTKGQIKYYSKLSRYYYSKSKIDSLEWAAKKGFSLAKNSKSDSLVAITANSLGTAYWAIGKIDTASYYYQIAYEKAVSANHKKVALSASGNIAMAALEREDYQKGLGIYHALLEEQLKNKYPPKNFISTYNGLAHIYRRMGEFEKANQYLFKALKICEENRIDDYKGIILLSIGTLYSTSKAYTEAIEKFKEAISFTKEKGNLKTIGNAKNNLGLVYLTLDSLDLAEACFIEALKIKRQLGNEAATNTTLGNLGVIAFKKKNYSKATEYTEEALNLQKKNNNKTQQVETYQLLAEIALAQKYRRRANKLINYSMSLAQEMSMKPELVEAYYIKAKVKASQDDYMSAYNYLFQHDSLNEKLLSEQNRKAVLEIETKYNNEKLKKENALQELEIQKKQYQITIQRGGLCGISFLTILLTIIALLIQSKRKIAQKNHLYEKERRQKIEKENKYLSDAEKQLKNTLKNTQERLTLLTETAENLIYLNAKHSVKLKEIKFIRKEGELLVFHLIEGSTIKLGDEMGIWEDILPSSLIFRIHTSCLVNLLYVQRRYYKYILLLDGTKLSVGRSRTNEFKKVWTAWTPPKNNAD